MSTRCPLFTLVYDVLSRMHFPVCVQQDNVCGVNDCTCIAHYSGTSEQGTLLVQRFLSFPISKVKQYTKVLAWG